MKSSLLCDNDPNKKLQIKCYNHSKIFKNDLIGVCYFEVKDLKLSASLHLLKEKHEHKNENSKNGDSRDNVEKVDNTENGYKHKNDDKHENGPEKWPKRGILEVTNFKSSRLYTFENYCENGLCFNSALAIDFSLNNGPFDNPQSLHFAGGYNEYESALYSLSTALSKFSTERRFSFWGLVSFLF
ncbi:Copine-3 [Bonamia ostreae]|uniref:Copine-3 n=1 Tax=Bonamia ostreae TaxID=126728 RepID=A0ABV2AUC2_9EUKA